MQHNPTNQQIYFAVVEDRKDPKKLGRVRVRVFGLHSPDINEIPTAALPWATICMPCTSPSMSGIGHNPFLLEGAWVVCMFIDTEFQEPIILGTIHGIPDEKREKQQGFTDPRGFYPRESALEMPDINERARGEENTLKKEAGHREPDDPYAAEYPYNRVFESESGHIIEVDDTPEHERINIYHRTGTFIEIHPNGDIRLRSEDHFNSTKNLILNIDGDTYVSVAENANITVEGDMIAETRGDTIVRAEGNILMETDNDFTLNAKKRILMNAEEEIEFRTASFYKLVADGKNTQDSGEETKIVAKKDLNIETEENFTEKANKNFTITAKGSMTETINGSIRRTARGSITDIGSRINLNPSGGSGGTAGDATEPEESEVEIEDLKTGEVDIDVQRPNPRFQAANPLEELEIPKDARPRKRTPEERVQYPADPRKLDPDPALGSDHPTNQEIPDDDADTVLSTELPNPEQTVVGGEDKSGGSLTYINQAALRNLRLNSSLESIIRSAAQSTGFHVVIFSGGQQRGVSRGYVGSPRHDNGYAADLRVYREFGRLRIIRFDDGNSDARRFVQALKSAGATSCGCGPGYGGGSMVHVDIAIGITVPEDAATHWGAEGKISNAPEWLKAIFG